MNVGFVTSTRRPVAILTFWHRSFTFNSNKSPTWCNSFSVYYPDVCLQLNMFRAFSRPSSGAQWLQWRPLVLPSYRGDSRAVFVVGPAGRPAQRFLKVNWNIPCKSSRINSMHFLNMTLFSVFIHAEANDSQVPHIVILWHAKLKCSSWYYGRFVTSEPLYLFLCAQLQMKSSPVVLINKI